LAAEGTEDTEYPPNQQAFVFNSANSAISVLLGVEFFRRSVGVV